MSGDKLSTELKWSIDETSVPGVPSAVQRWDVPDGANVTVRSGVVAIADFQTAAANSGPSGNSADPSRQTRIALGYREPNDPLGAWTVFTQEQRIAPFNDLSLKDQQSSENAQNRVITFDPEEVGSGSFTFEDADEIALLVIGPDEVDGSDSQFAIPMEFNNG
ncbi:hypothetical protein [Halosimplex pelagicum]|uniref:Uncharacterized protein n=1 Tax=Halosimplex pelagicum TaxID=869886 RepID=A0A7D5TDU1_9EURY|nr:hypothetical protein [Halosimplex pelagicum]QLH83355.1 hypothetical protein HZS54_17715 [Halosimplex pelagicum]